MPIKVLILVIGVYGAGLAAGCDTSDGGRLKARRTSSPSESSQLDEEPVLKDAIAYATRAHGFVSEGEYDKALKDFDRAVQLQPDQAAFRNSRGFTWHMKGIRDKDRPACEDRALSDYAEAIRLNPNSASAINNRAWLLATSKVDRCRDGKLAVEEATKACEFTDWKNSGYLDTLSCAYAELGDFKQAIRWQEKALEDPSYKQAEGEIARTKISLFGNQKPFWE